MNTLARAAFTAALALLTACSTFTPQETRFKILQLNDVYKIEGLEGGTRGGLARVRALREELERDGSAVLILHGGDALYPSVMSKHFDARAMIDVMNRLDGDNQAFDPGLVVTFGNHEFDNPTPDVLLARMRESQFRWVATNTWMCSGRECDQRFAGADLTTTIEVGNRRIGMFGLLAPLNRGYVEAREVVETARKAVRSLRMRNADVIIAITHQEMRDDRRLVEQVPGIDLVIGGHDHIAMQQQVGDTWITKSDADAISVYVHDVVVSPSGNVSSTPRRVVLDASMPEDGIVRARVDHWRAQLDKKLGGNKVLGTTTHLLGGLEPDIRGRETALGNLIADAMRDHMQTDIAVVNGGSIRINDNIPPGPITTYDMEGIFYYTNQIVAARLTGAEVLEMLRHGVSLADYADGRFLQVSGLRFSYRKTGETADTVAYEIRPEDVEVGGRPLDLTATYTVAMTDYLYANGTDDGFDLFGDARRPPKVAADREKDFRTVVETYIRERGTVNASVEGRIRRE
jgi:2',3'-cyclic-nucleotide 2'-phosphodiesterase (5'-nucleotidase family)